jgi:2-hydroxy-3-keto-5-methylthiopentenyl-1-phosphate phosphatase
MGREKLVIAVDFDGTLCEHDFPDIGEIGEVHAKVIAFLRIAKSRGSTIILWTCREDLPERKYLSEAVAWCEKNDIPVDYVNEYPMPGFPGFATRKVCADIYIDDKDMNISDFADM